MEQNNVIGSHPLHYAASSKTPRDLRSTLRGCGTHTDCHNKLPALSLCPQICQVFCLPHTTPRSAKTNNVMLG